MAAFGETAEHLGDIAGESVADGDDDVFVFALGDDVDSLEQLEHAFDVFSVVAKNEDAAVIQGNDTVGQFRCQGLDQ